MKQRKWKKIARATRRRSLTRFMHFIDNKSRTKDEI
jgi:hypothetical protein